LAPTSDRRRFIRAEVDRDITHRLQRQSFVTISGIGGLGKSTAAAVGAANQHGEPTLAQRLRSFSD